MTPPNVWFVIAINQATAAQREQVHEIVKASTGTWWHAFADAWIVQGRTAGEWRDLVGEPFRLGPGGVIVLKVDDAGATWAYRAQMSDTARKWLRDNL
jgi:hypothetical protein